MPNGKVTAKALRDREGKRLWIQTQAGEFVPVRSQQDITKRGQGRGEPDWWVVAKDPDWSPLPPRAPGPARSLISAAADAGGTAGTAEEGGGDNGGDGGEGGAGSGEGTKIGAGNKPQPYGWHGWYGSTGGSGTQGKDSKKPGTGGHSGTGTAQKQGAKRPGGSLGSGTKPPAKVIWKNDERGKPDSKPEDVTPKTRETVERLSKEVPGIETLEVNSGLREGDAGPHGKGCAVDIRRVNDVRLAEVAGKTGASAEQTRQDVKKIEEWSRKNPDVQVFLSPSGGFIRDPVSGNIVREATWEEMEKHKNHIHITVRK